MAEPPRLTDAEATVMRRMNMNLVEWHSALDSLHTRGLRKASGATPIGLAALAAYDAEQRRAISIEAMRRCERIADLAMNITSVFGASRITFETAKNIREEIRAMIAKEESNG